MDYGVDATFEVLVDSRPTNCISQIQIKAIRTATLNQDGSISKAIEVSNLNYLLNGPCPIYLLYMADQNRFMFVWAWDVLRQLEVDNPAWRDQGTVTIRFSSDLNDKSLQDIHSRIVRESRARRDFLDIIVRYASHETVKLSIDPKTFKTKTAEEAYQCLLRHGLALVSRGSWREVVEMCSLLSIGQRRRPKISLILGYAHFFEGRYLASMACCGDVQFAHRRTHSR